MNYYIPSTKAITASEYIDSRDVIERIEDLESADEENPLTAMDAEELESLRELADNCSSSPDWEHGETLIRHDAFTDYIKELINDCYEMPKDITSGKWPWTHMQMDYEGAAEEAKQDYIEINWRDTYFIRG